MNRQEVAELLNLIDVNCRNFSKDKDIDAMMTSWLEVLCEYEYKDVKNRLKQCLAQDMFQYQPPTVYYLVKELQKKQDKVDFKKQVIYCNICGRAFNYEDKLKNHFERCSSVRYIITQCKKWGKKDLNKRELYEMGEEEFNEKYEKLLHYIYEHTTNEKEKTRIGFIFNPPGAEIAKKFLEGNG